MSRTSGVSFEKRWNSVRGGGSGGQGKFLGCLGFGTWIVRKVRLFAMAVEGWITVGRELDSWSIEEPRKELMDLYTCKVAGPRGL